MVIHEEIEIINTILYQCYINFDLKNINKFEQNFTKYINQFNKIKQNLVDREYYENIISTFKEMSVCLRNDISMDQLYANCKTTEKIIKDIDSLDITNIYNLQKKIETLKYLFETEVFVEEYIDYLYDKIGEFEDVLFEIKNNKFYKNHKNGKNDKNFKNRINYNFTCTNSIKINFP